MPRHRATNRTCELTDEAVENGVARLAQLDEARQSKRARCGRSARARSSNYFGRLTTLWSVCSDKYRWTEANHDTLFKTCVALTNFHVHLNPLRAVDEVSYRNYLGHLLFIGEEVISKRKTPQKHHRSRREERLPSMFRVRRDSLETSRGRQSSDNSSLDSDETVFGS